MTQEPADGGRGGGRHGLRCHKARPGHQCQLARAGPGAPLRVISALGSQNPPVLVVAAAGNSGSDNTKIPILPASYRGSVRGKPPLDNLIAVMATDDSDEQVRVFPITASTSISPLRARIFSARRSTLSARPCRRRRRSTVPPTASPAEPPLRRRLSPPRQACCWRPTTGRRRKSETSSSPRAIRSPICRAPVGMDPGSTWAAPCVARSCHAAWRGRNVEAGHGLHRAMMGLVQRADRRPVAVQFIDQGSDAVLHTFPDCRTAGRPRSLYRTAR